MKGLTILTEENTGKKIAQIDLNQLIKHSSEFEEFFDRLIAESRRNEKDLPWNGIKRDLRKKGRL